jgi:hypothetical protein
MRRPSFSVSAETPRAALTIAGVTGGATLPEEAQPPIANAIATGAAKKTRLVGRMEKCCAGRF